MTEHKYGTVGKIGPYARSRDSRGRLVAWIAEHGMHKLKDVKYSNPKRLDGKLSQKLNRAELLKLWVEVDAFRSKQKSN
jgi:hypothetical protein